MIIDELRAMAIFAEVAKYKSFRGAAKFLGLSPSVVSYHISQLENQIGTALVYRSTRKLSLSHEGEILYKHIQNMMHSAQLGIEQVTQKESSPSGKLNITIPSALIKAPITEKISTFAKQFPNIELNLSYSDHREDLIANGIDLAIRAGELPDSNLRAKTIGSIERKLVCSPEFFRTHPEPIAPQNLKSWQWIKLAMLPSYRTFQHKKHGEVNIEFSHQISVNNVDAMTQLCILGNGLATPADYQVDHAIEQDQLIHVLPQWRVKPKPIYAVWPINVSPQSIAKKLINYLSE